MSNDQCVFHLFQEIPVFLKYPLAVSTYFPVFVFYPQDLPEHGVVGVFQEDDIRLTKEKLGKKMAIAGGLSTTIMQHGTKQECIDHVKGLIDDLCPGGGYFIAPDTPMMFPIDAKPENLKAIADYIRDYRL